GRRGRADPARRAPGGPGVCVRALPAGLPGLRARADRGLPRRAAARLRRADERADRRGPRRAGRGRPRRPAGQRGHLDGGLGDGGRAGAPARPSPTTTLNRDPPGHPLPGPPRPPVRGPSSTGTASTTPTRRWHGGPGAPGWVTSVTPNGGVRVAFLEAR